MEVVITGGTGRLGTKLTRSLVSDDHQVIVLSRSPQAKRDRVPSEAQIAGWDAKSADGWLEHADGADVIVNFAGEDLAGGRFIPKRWTERRRRLIRESRRQAGQAIVEAVRRVDNKPELVLQASASGYYGTNLSQEVKTEDSPPGEDFLAQVCVEWEAATQPVEELGVRRVITRTGIVLDPSEGPLPRLLLPMKLFVGGPLGSGNQFYPWIHVADPIRAYRFLMESPDSEGPYNVAAPRPVTNQELIQTLGEVINRPSFFPTPGFALRLALGDVASLVLEGQRMVPQRLQDADFAFEQPELKPALEDLLA